MKRTLVIAVVAVVILAFCGCSSSSAGTSVSSRTATASTTATSIAATSQSASTASSTTPSTAAPSIEYALSEYTRDNTLSGGYSYTATLKIGPWVRASDTETINGIWKKIGASGSAPDVDSFTRNNPMAFSAETSVMTFGTIAINDTTQGGFNIADSNSVMQQSVYSRDLMYSMIGCSSCVNFSDGNKYVVQTNGSGSSPGAILELTPKMTGRSWGPVPFVICCSGAISPEHPDGDPMITSAVWYYGGNEFTVPSMLATS